MTQEYKQAEQSHGAAWKGAIVQMLGAIGAREDRRDEYEDFLCAICITSIRGGIMSGFGEAQSYLRRVGSPSQFIALPAPASASPRTPYFDVVAGENAAKDYYVGIVRGHEDVRRRLGRFMLSDEMNEHLLERRAGITQAWWCRYGPPNGISHDHGSGIH